MAEHTFPDIGDKKPGTDQGKQQGKLQGKLKKEASKQDENKHRALGAALAQIERQFGKGSVMRLGDHELVAIPAISTGSI